MMQTIKLSIVVPCYNEAKNIPLILDRFSQVIQRNDIEVILVNNGSQDDSQETLESLVPQYPFARTLKIDVNQGYGFGITTGLNATVGEYIGYTHADMQTNPADLIKALDILEDQAQSQKIYVKGNRKGRSWADQVFTVGMSFFETIYLKTKLWDINAQPNVFHRSFWEKVKLQAPKDFSFDLYMLYCAQKLSLKIIRFDVLFPPRVNGQSSWNTGLISKWKFIKRTLAFSFKLKKEL